MIISRTPFRISFFGGGTDYPVWFRENGGSVLGTSIDKYCYITCRYLPPFFEHRHRIVYSQIENVKAIEEVRHPAVREIVKFLEVSEGLEIHHDGDLPARTGLGSSSSFAVGLLHALSKLKGLDASKMKLARDAIYIERDMIHENVGCQDQVFAAFGGLNIIRFCETDEIVVEPLEAAADRIQLLQQHLMLFFTGFSRTASDIAGEQIKETKENKTNHTRLHRMHQMVGDAAGILQGSGNLDGFGELLHEGWELKRNLTSLISTPTIDSIYEQARNAGAIGGKLLGAGGGGFMLFYVKPEQQPAVVEALKDFLHVPFAFDNTGSRIIFHNGGS